jgi:hypothetical protein
LKVVEVPRLSDDDRSGIEHILEDVAADLTRRCGDDATVSDAGQGGAGATTSNERPSTRTKRQEKASLLREAKLKLVLKYLEDEPSLRDLDYRRLSAALKPKGVSVNPAFLSRNLRDTEYDRGRARGNPHRAAPGKGEREAVAVDDPADFSKLDAWTMPDDPV